MKRYVWQNLSPAERDNLLRRPALAVDDRLRDAVAAILSRVRAGGDKALRELTRELDRVDLADILVSQREFDAAPASLESSDRTAIRMAAVNIARFHRPQRPRPLSVETTPGVVCERLTRPIARVGLYVPAGSAPLPSTALMLGVPAHLAGCPTRVLCSPPRSDGRCRCSRTLCGTSLRDFHRFPGWRRTGHRGNGLRHRNGAEGRQDFRPGQ